MESAWLDGMEFRRVWCRTTGPPSLRASGLHTIVYGNGKTILRGGGGIFYERNAGNEEYNMGANVPFSNSATTIYPYLDTTTTTWVNGASAGKSPTTPQGFTGIQKKYPITRCISTAWNPATGAEQHGGDHGLCGQHL